MKKLSILVFIFLVGCQQMVWNKPNGTQQEFAQVKYQCLKNSQQYGESLNINRNLGMATGSAGQYTNEQLFASCMNSQGWYLTSQKQANESNQQNPNRHNDLALSPQAKQYLMGSCSELYDEAFVACMKANKSQNQTKPSNTTANFHSSLPDCFGSNVQAWNNCKGSYTYPNGNAYTGEFVNGMRDGQGTIRIVAKGQSNSNYIGSDVPATYTGSFKNNRINGKGVWVTDKGERKEGKFVDNIFVGK